VSAPAVGGAGPPAVLERVDRAPAARRSVGGAAAIGALWWREIVRFLRQRSRVVGAFAQPLLFWLLLGGGFSA